MKKQEEGIYKVIKVLHCPRNIAGNPYNLAKAERKLGLESWSVSLDNDPFKFICDENLWNDNLALREINRFRLLLRAVKDYDIIHFNFGHSLMPDWSTVQAVKNKNLQKLYHKYISLFALKDLPVLKKLGKGIVVTFQGDDGRQGDYCIKHFKITHADKMPHGYYSDSYDNYKRKKIAAFAKYADKIYALNPDLLHVLPKNAKFMPYAHIDINQWKPVTKSGEKPVVIHAPSDRFFKGTKYLVDAVRRLQKEKINFEFRLVEGVTHNKVKQLYEQADILVDQLLAGWYGGLAVELMALGKPVICYIRNEDLKFIPPDMKKDLPIINATPNSIYKVLKSYLTDKKKLLPELGKRSRKYVEIWHDPLKIAHDLKADYEEIFKKANA